MLLVQLWTGKCEEAPSLFFSRGPQAGRRSRWKLHKVGCRSGRLAASTVRWFEDSSLSIRVRSVSGQQIYWGKKSHPSGLMLSKTFLHIMLHYTYDVSTLRTGEQFQTRQRLHPSCFSFLAVSLWFGLGHSSGVPIPDKQQCKWKRWREVTLRVLNYPQLRSTDCLPVGICVSGEHQ